MENPSEQVKTQTAAYTSSQVKFDWQWAFYRAKSMLLSPNETWPQVQAENTSTKDLYIRYVLALAAIPPICGLLSSTLFQGGAFGHVLLLSSVQYLLSLGIMYVFALVIEFIVPKFEGNSSRNSALGLLAYAYTASFIGGIFALIPGIIGGLLATAMSVYSIYLFYLGIPHMTKVPDSRRVPFLITCIIAGFLLSLLIGGLVITMILGSVGMSAIGVS